MTEALRCELADQIAKKHALVVVGTGVSLASTGGNALASWRGLIANGVQRCVERGICNPTWANAQKGLLEGDHDDLLGVAEQVSRRLGWKSTDPCDRDWNAWLRATVGALHAKQPELIQAIRDLGVPIATLNYDDLLTEVTGRRPITWMDAERWLPVLRGEDKAILHLHGHWDQPRSVVLGIRSYDAAIGKALAQHIQRALASLHSLVFIGCSGTVQDPNFTALVDWMSDRLPGAEHYHYILLLEGETLPLAPPLLRKAGIIPLRYGQSHANLLPYIQSLLPSTRPIKTTYPGSAKPRLPKSLLLPFVNLLITKTSLHERCRRDSLVEDYLHCFGDPIVHRSIDPETDLIEIITQYQYSDNSLRYLLRSIQPFIPDRILWLIRATLHDIFLINELRITIEGSRISPDTIRRHYVASRPGSQLSSIESSLEQSLFSLCEMQSRHKGMLRPIFEFALRLARETDSTQLSKWLFDHANAAEIEATSIFLDSETYVPFSYLIIDIPSSDVDIHGSIDYWQYSGDNAFIDRYSEPWDGTCAQLNQAIANIITKSREWSVDLIIEIFAPQQLLHLSLDGLCISPAGEPWRVEEMYPIHLRWRERASGMANTAIKSWKFIARRITRTNIGISTCWLSEHSATGPKLVNDLRDGALGNCLGFMFRPFLGADGDIHMLLRSALIGGMPLGVWSRVDKGDWHLFQKVISEIIDGCSVDDASKKLRAAYSAGFGERVTLFWDDPARNPLECQLEPLGRRDCE